ncbi:MAG: DMT family transporter [Aquificaceae bacterium]|nr:DMT family transporter [Aquificaceae bacterium]MDW8237226.1 DMT family transporter [Aquificaceae bacterium]
MHEGILLSFLSALSFGINDFLNKRLLKLGLDEGFVLWVRFPIATLILTPFAIANFQISQKLIAYSLIWLPLEVIAGILFMRALKYLPLGIGVGIYSLMPLFSALFEAIFLGQSPGSLGYAGILLIILGAILLGGGIDRGANLRPVIDMLMASAIYGFNVVIGKMSVLESSGLFFSWYYSLLMSFGTLIFVRGFKKVSFSYQTLSVGFLFALGEVFYNLALSLSMSAYVSAIERTSFLIATLLGWVFLKERVIRVLPAGLLMFIGSLLIGLD